MKKYKILLSVLLVTSLLISSNTRALAQGIEEFREDYRYFIDEEQRRLEEIIESENPSEWLGIERENLPLDSNTSSYVNCSDCVVFSVTVCAAEAILRTEGYHRAFFDLFETDCYAYYFTSRGAVMCPNCASVLEVYDEHWCWEYHTECSKGRFYDVCPMDISDF